MSTFAHGVQRINLCGLALVLAMTCLICVNAETSRATSVAVGSEQWSVVVPGDVTALAADPPDLVALTEDVMIQKNGVAGEQYLVRGGHVVARSVGPGLPTSALSVDGQVYIAGGSFGPHTYTSGQNEVIDEAVPGLNAERTFSVATPLAMAEQDGVVWVLSGGSNDNELSLDRLDGERFVVIRRLGSIGWVPGNIIVGCIGDLFVAGSQGDQLDTVLMLDTSGTLLQRWTLPGSGGVYLSCGSSGVVAALGQSGGTVWLLTKNHRSLLTRIQGLLSGAVVMKNRVWLLTSTASGAKVEKLVLSELSMQGENLGAMQWHVPSGGPPLLSGSNGQLFIGADGRVLDVSSA